MIKKGPKEWRPAKAVTVELEKALASLLEFVTSGRSYESKNPYLIPEVEEAIRLLDPEGYRRIYGPHRR